MDSGEIEKIRKIRQVNYQARPNCVFEEHWLSARQKLAWSYSEGRSKTNEDKEVDLASTSRFKL